MMERKFTCTKHDIDTLRDSIYRALNDVPVGTELFVTVKWEQPNLNLQELSYEAFQHLMHDSDTSSGRELDHFYDLAKLVAARITDRLSSRIMDELRDGLSSYADGLRLSLTILKEVKAEAFAVPDAS